MHVFQQADAHTWGAPVAFDNATAAMAYVKAYRDQFQRQRLILPVYGLDYRVLTGDRARQELTVMPGREPSPLAVRVCWVLGVLDECREAMEAAPVDFCLQSVPGRVRLMHDAMRRIQALAEEAQETGRAPRQALAAIEGIAHHAMQREYEPPVEGVATWLREVEGSAVEDMPPQNDAGQGLAAGWGCR